MKYLRSGLLLSIACLVTGCGGGSSGGGEQISGKVIDGYISGADVYWDCNNNHQLDSGELSVKTTIGGLFNIAPAPNSNCALAAYVGIGAIDSDNPNQAIISPYTLLAAPGKPEIITPLTSMVYGLLKSSPEMTVDDADKKIVAELGLGSSVFKNYMPDSDAYDEKNKLAAKYIAQNLQVQVASSNDVLATTYQSVKSASQDSSFYSSLKNGYTPFNYDKNYLLNYFKINIPAPNSNFIAVLSDHKESAENNSYMEQIANKLTSDGNVGYGAPYFNGYDSVALRDWMFGIKNRNIGQNNPDVGTVISKFRSDRDSKLNELRQNISYISEETGFFTAYAGLFTTDGRATFDYMLGSASAILSMEIDAVDIYVSQGMANRLKSTAIGVKHLDRLEKLKKSIEAIGLAPDTVACYLDSSDYIKGKTDSPRNLIKSCKDFVTGLNGVFGKIKTIDVLSNIGSTAVDGTILATANFSKLDTREKTVAYWKHFLDAFDSVKDLYSIVAQPGSVSRAVASVDMARQLVGMYINAVELTDNVMASKAAAIEAFDKQTKDVFASYYANYVGAYSWYFTVVDSTKDVYLKNASPRSVTAGSGVKFTISGGNFPLSSGLTASIGGANCSILGDSSVSVLNVTCDITSDSTSKMLSIKYNGSDIVGSPFAVSISPAKVETPLCEAGIDIIKVATLSIESDFLENSDATCYFTNKYAYKGYLVARHTDSHLYLLVDIPPGGIDHGVLPKYWHSYSKTAGYWQSVDYSGTFVGLYFNPSGSKIRSDGDISISVNGPFLNTQPVGIVYYPSEFVSITPPSNPNDGDIWYSYLSLGKSSVYKNYSSGWTTNSNFGLLYKNGMTSSVAFASHVYAKLAVPKSDIGISLPGKTSTYMSVKLTNNYGRGYYLITKDGQAANVYKIQFLD
ncbi:hypothetical protein AEP_03705 [Curvibacter sp. AEP1-3]|uniref:hypothetical protein n=1 Tax=Curvibacter sp. AEP1-3 TaxID=1844971 RepID=UPI000B57CA67|nr:hypothetical protein [Curvibacter sp. AEP1-3]ARV20623.1 hypothetical protein AEP_03705 [Curvibacter sp. AEP1-3]